MQHHNREVVKDVHTALQLEQELQLSQAQHGVAVLDVYSGEWGNSKALSETFRRLYTDAGDQVHLRFFSVECNSIIESLNYPEEQRNPQRPRDLDMCRETLPAFWSEMLRNRRGKSKSYFVFYKEGKKRASIEGISTPKITNYVKDLCRPQKPVSESVTNEELIKFWKDHFIPSESEVFWDSFVSEMLVSTAVKRNLTSKEEGVLADAIGIKGYRVAATDLEKWIGDNQTLQEAFLTVLPHLKEKTQPTEDNSKSNTNEEQQDKNIALGKEVSESVSKTVGTHEMRKESLKPKQWQHLVATSLQYPDDDKRLTLLSCDDGEEAAKKCLEQCAELPTLREYLSSLGVTMENIQVLCHAADEKISSESLSYGKLAVVLMLCDDESLQEYIGRQEDFRGKLSRGEILLQHPSLAFTSICLCPANSCGNEFIRDCSDEESTECIRNLNVGDSIILPPFSRFFEPKESTEFTSAVKIVGVPEFLNFDVTNDDAVFLNRWFAKLHVTEKSENSITLTFVETVEESNFQQFAQSFSQRLNEDEERLPKSTEVLHLPERTLDAALDVASPYAPVHTHSTEEPAPLTHFPGTDNVDGVTTPLSTGNKATADNDAQQPIETEEAEENVNQEDGNQPAETAKVEEKTDQEDAQQPTETEEAWKELDHGDVQQPTESEEAGEKTDQEDAQQPTESEEAGEKTDQEDAQQPTESEEAGEKTDQEDAQQPTESEEAGEKTDQEDAQQPTESEEAGEKIDQEDVQQPTENEEAWNELDHGDVQQPTETEEAEKEASADAGFESQDSMYGDVNRISTRRNANPHSSEISSSIKYDEMRAFFLGSRGYCDVLDLQTGIFQQKIKERLRRLQGERGGSEIPDIVLLVEHSFPVYTVGRRDTSEGIPQNTEVKVVRTRRGGGVTFHGPGQVTMYPIVDVQRLWKNCTSSVKSRSPIEWYSFVLEQSMIDTAKDYGVPTHRRKVGVWTDEMMEIAPRKIGSIGLQLGNWVSMHGAGFNVCNDLEYFNKIVMCEMPEESATTLLEEMRLRRVHMEDPSPRAVASELLSHFLANLKQQDDIGFPGLVDVSTDSNWSERVLTEFASEIR